MFAATSWYVARSAGIAAWLFLMATIVWGSVTAGRFARFHKPLHRWMVDLHPVLGALSVLLLGVHLTAVLVDPTVSFSPVDVFVPFASSWRTLAVTWGVIAFWIIVGVQVTSQLRRHLSRRTWRGVHLTSYALCWATTLHAVGAGTDMGNRVVAWVALGVIAITTAAGVARWLTAKPRRPTRQPLSHNQLEHT